MTIATGVAKRLAYKVQSGYHTAPGTTAAQYLRRVTSSLSVRKPPFESQEKVTHYQRQSQNFGMRTIGGTIAGELSPGTYSAFIAAGLRRAFSSVSAMTGLSITITGSGPTWTVARGTGSFLTDGVKRGMVVRLTAGSFNAANINKNLAVLEVTALQLTVMPLNGVAMAAEGPIASATVSVPGKVNYVPSTGHTDQSFAIEHYHTDVAVSELFLDCKFQEMAVNLPPSGNAAISFNVIGSDIVRGTSAYYSSPTAETATDIVTAINGILSVDGAKVGLVTGANFTVRSAMTPAGPVYGLDYPADITEGRVIVDGQMTVLLQDGTFADYFTDETEIALHLFAAGSKVADADFMTFSLPRIKLGSDEKDDPEAHITQTMSFSALLNDDGGAGTHDDASTISVHDSAAA